MTSSNSYIENASAQLFTLNQASDILQSTANELSKGKIDENTLETLNTCLDEAITQLSDTIKINQCILEDAQKHSESKS